MIEGGGTVPVPRRYLERSMRATWTALAFVLAITVTAAPAAAERGSPVVVELFTSQGCSSCPPADALLVDLARDRPDVLPLAFHVTYWNRLGWHDPYSLDAATDRQRRYAAQLATNQVYTPEIVIDGSRDVVGSDRNRVLGAIRAATSQADITKVLAVRRADGVKIEIGAGDGAGMIWLIGYDGQHRTSVTSGENGGHSLLEANIVRSVRSVGRWNGSPFQTLDPAPSGEQSAVLLQADDGRILGAARVRDASAGAAGSATQ
jgi:hypothetical protein